jgi:hypothetical protein
MLALFASLTVLLTPGATSFALGDEIPVTFVITNTATSPYEYTERSYDRSGRIGEFQVIVARDGVPLIDPRTLRQGGYIGGGLGRTGTLAPGASFKQTIALNLWALVDGPGIYSVIGRYHFDGGHADSAPVTITVTPRTGAEMGRHIEQLGAALHASASSDERQQIVQRLAFTRDARAVPFILEGAALGANESFWAGEAFAYYVPRTATVRETVVAHARANGLKILTAGMLADLGVAEDEIKSIIAASLEPAHRDAWIHAALGAQRYGDDRFMPRLIEIAAIDRNPAREQAIYALALHRTDAGVAALKRHLVDPNARIREMTANAIRTAYQFRGVSQGRPLRPDDFPDLARK